MGLSPAVAIVVTVTDINTAVAARAGSGGMAL